MTLSLIVPLSPRSDPRDLEGLLASVRRQNFPGVEVLVVSDRESRVGLPKRHRTVPMAPLNFLSVPQGTGASAARNFAASIARGRVLGFLDDDVVLQDGWCEQCLSSFSDESVGAVTGKAFVRLDRYGFDFVPTSLMWTVGGTYWDSDTIRTVYSAAGMNFCIRKDVFQKVGGYATKLGPMGDRPETATWHRLGAEESDLVLRIWESTTFKVLYNPAMVVEHRLRPESLLPRGLVRRALHVGHNRAYIHAMHPRNGGTNDLANLRGLLSNLGASLHLLIRRPVYAWKRVSFTILVVSAFILGYVEGMFHFKVISTSGH